MQITVIIVFALVFWRSEWSASWLLTNRDDLAGTLALVLGPPLGIAGAALACTRHARRLLTQFPDDYDRAQQFHYRATAALRYLALVGFGATIFLTPWPQWLELQSVHPTLQIISDWIVLVPFVLTLVLLWMGTHSVESAIRVASIDRIGTVAFDPPVWKLGRYLDFHLRHHFLTVAVPMSLILFAANLVRGYRTELESRLRFAWAPDLIVGTAAAIVFIVTPLLLRRVWRTHSLEPGPLRSRLETLCRRIGLSVRDILVWDSGGLMVNAAVMGVFAPVRYVLLSDALLAVMSIRQIEAVFGHEAGHVRHRHIQHLLVFAFVGWLLVAGIMEYLGRGLSMPTADEDWGSVAIQCVGMGATAVFWGLGFGWLSRRFERQADIFGAWCVTPLAGECRRPCGVHLDGVANDDSEERVCTTAAETFASALDRVAVLNGIPHDERSWRHSSIASRIRFLMSLAGDPQAAVRFQQTIRSWKFLILATAALGTLVSVVYGILMF